MYLPSKCTYVEDGRKIRAGSRFSKFWGPSQVARQATCEAGTRAASIENGHFAEGSVLYGGEVQVRGVGRHLGAFEGFPWLIIDW